MNDRRLAFLYSPEIEGLSYPPDCPFKTQRAGLTRQRLMSFGLLGTDGRIEVAPRKATLAELKKFHTARYLKELQRVAGGDLPEVQPGPAARGERHHRQTGRSEVASAALG